MTDVKGESGEKELSPDVKERKNETGAVKTVPLPAHEGGAQVSAHFSIQPATGFPSHVQASNSGEGHASYPPDLRHPTPGVDAAPVVANKVPNPSTRATQGDVSPLEKLAEIVSSSRENEITAAVPAIDVQSRQVLVEPTDRLVAPQIPVIDAPAKTGFWARRRQRKALLAALAEQAPRTANEKRWARRRRRLWLEELLGWIFVPIILIALYWSVIGIFALMGTTPDAVISGIRQVLGHR